MAGPFIKWVERQAGILRGKIPLTPIAPLDPYVLAARMGVEIISPREIVNLSEETKNHLLRIDSDGWSAGTLCLPNGQNIVVLNDNHAQTRRHATLMEELSHIFLKHQPTMLNVMNGQIATRSYNKNNEMQAYWVGAAALVPEKILQHAVANELSRESLAKYCRVSKDLVKFRENILRIRLP